MRISELLGSPVLDAAGDEIGFVQDLRARREVESGDVGTRGRIRVSALVLGGARLSDKIAHSWGFAEGRARGPALLRWLARPGVRRSRVVSASDVASWAPGEVRLRVAATQLQPFEGTLERE